MKDRIKLLRNNLNLSQDLFAKKLGYSYAAIQKWEKGGNISESSLKLIERTYNVNPSWLREGVGEMFMADSNIEQSPLKQEVISKISELNEEQLTRLAGYIDSMQFIVKSGKKIRGGEF